MIPLILISSNLEKQEEYISDFIKEHKISPYFTYKIHPLKTEITIDQIREIKKEIITKTNTIRLFICYSFDSANLEAQNAFLKTLEEKNDQNQFILLAKNIERLLPTIRSRSAIHNLDHGVGNPTVSNSYAHLFNKAKASETYDFLSEPIIQGLTREDAEKFFDEFALFIRNICRENNYKYIPVLKKVLQTKSLLQNNNLNPQLAADSVLILFNRTSKQA